MCEACTDGTPAEPVVDDVEAMWRLAERIERGRPGSAASPDHWAVLRGRRSGSVPFQVLIRLAESRSAAIAMLAAGGGFRCSAPQDATGA